MGKKSLTKSTSKKKATKKKSTAKSDEVKTDTTQSKTQKTASKKSSAPKKPTLKSLRKKDFGTWAPETLYAPQPETGAYTAPPAIEATDKKTDKTFKDLLKKQFDPAKPAKPAKKTAAKSPKKDAKPASPKKPAQKTTKKKTVSVQDLIKKQFGTWAPETLFTPAPAEAHFSAPPIADKGDENKFRELISREFDLSKVTPRPPAEPEEAAPAAAAVQPEKPTEPAEQEKAPAEQAPEAVQKEPRPEPSAHEAPQASAAAEAEEKPESAAKTTNQPPASTPADSPSEKPEPAPAADKPEPQPAAEKAKPGKKETAEKQKAATAAKSGKSAPKASVKGEKAKQPPRPPSGDGGEPPMPSPPGGPQEPREPMSNALKILIISVAAIFACIILASALNSSKYYIKPGDAGVEIWKGDFSPRGKKKLVTLEDTTMPSDAGEGAVSKQKAYSLPFDYYMQRAERLSGKPGVPNFEAIRKELKKAKKYAVTNKQLQKVKNRLDHIEFIFLLNKADMAAGQDSAEGYDKALEYLHQARELTATPSQREMVARQIREAREAREKEKEKVEDRVFDSNH